LIPLAPARPADSVSFSGGSSRRDRGPSTTVGSLLSGLAVPWWITGGWAIDLAVGHRTRDHADVNLMIRRRHLGL
jgi:hypothetical protein